MKKRKLYITDKKNIFSDGGVWDSLAQKDFAKHPWNYSQDYLYGGTGPSITEQYMNSKNAFGISKENNPFSKGNIKGSWGAMVGAIPENSFSIGDTEYRRGAWDLADPLYQLAGNKKTAVGEGLSDAGVSLVKSGNGVAAIVGAGLKVFGDLINAGWGTYTDEEMLKKYNDAINYYSTFTPDAQSYDTLPQIMSMAASGNPYEGGWFKGDWERDNNKKIHTAYNDSMQYAYENLDRNIFNIDQNSMRDAMIHSTAFGGPLHTYGADWDNKLTFINNGGTHEQNPYEGVPMGIAPDGKPNLVEEGEVIWKDRDYVFSDRIEVPQAVRDKYKLRGIKDMSFAYAVKKVQKESEERPNDPISKRGLEDILNKLMNEQEAIRQSEQTHYAAKGGGINIAKSKRGTFTAAAKKHGMGVQEFASKVLSNPSKYSVAMRKKANFARNAAKWKHADGGHIHAIDGYLYNADTMSEDEYNNLINSSLVFNAEPLNIPDIESKAYNPSNYGPRVIKVPVTMDFLPNDYTGNLYEGRGTGNRNSKFSINNLLRKAPILGNAIAYAYNRRHKPDYTNADKIDSAANSLLQDVSYKPVSRRLKRRFMSVWPLLFRQGANARATDRAIMNNAAPIGTKIAGLLANAYNNQIAEGDLYRKALEYNDAKDLQYEDLEMKGDMVDATNYLKAQMASNEIRSKKLGAIMEAAKMREAMDAARAQALSDSYSGIWEGLGALGREGEFWDWINSNPAYSYALLNDGVKHKGKKGGYLTIKKRGK